MNKKAYEAAQMAMTEFDTEDVITTSGAYEPDFVDPDDLPIMPAN